MVNIDYEKEIDSALKEVKDLNPRHGPRETKMVRALIQVFLAMFVYEDRETTKKFIAPNYVQHNPFLSEGPESPFEYARNKRQQTLEDTGFDGPPTLKFKRFLVDGNLLTVVLHWINYPGDLGLNIVDIFKWNGEQFTEHWDCNQDVLHNKFHRNPNGIF